MARTINSFTEEEKEKIVNEYKNNVSMRELELRYGVSRQTLSKYLTKIGVKTSVGNHYRKYFHNEDFFETIDTEEKAYWLGFMFADGYILNKENKYGQDAFGLKLAEKDIHSLQQFKISIAATNPITWDNSKNTGQPQGRLLMYSQKTVNDLIEKGCVKQKSLILNPPKDVPEKLLKHFIRGFFDGDGHVSYTLHETYIAPHFGFTTTYEMANWLKEQFTFGSIVKEKRREKTYYFSGGGINRVKQAYHFLYDDATIWMDRKYEKFQEIFSKYAEMRGSIE